MAAPGSLEMSQSKRETIVNIGEGEGGMESRETRLAAVQENSQRIGFSEETSSTMGPTMLEERAPPPPYQELNNFYPPTAPLVPSTQVPPSPIFPSIPSRSSPPPSYSQIDLSSHHFPSPHLPSRHGGTSSQIPSLGLAIGLGPGGVTSHLPSQLGGARPKKLQPTNQQLTNKQMTAALRRAGLTNGQRIVNVRLKEEDNQEQEEMSGTGKGRVAIAIFVIMFFVLYLMLPYTPFSPWD